MNFFICSSSLRILSLVLFITIATAEDGLRTREAFALNTNFLLGYQADSLCNAFIEAEYRKIPGFWETLGNGDTLKEIAWITCLNAADIVTAIKNAAIAAPAPCASLLQPFEADARVLAGVDCDVMKPNESRLTHAASISIVFVGALVFVGGVIWVGGRANNVSANTHPLPTPCPSNPMKMHMYAPRGRACYLEQIVKNFGLLATGTLPRDI